MYGMFGTIFETHPGGKHVKFMEVFMRFPASQRFRCREASTGDSKPKEDPEGWIWEAQIFQNGAKTEQKRGRQVDLN